MVDVFLLRGFWCVTDLATDKPRVTVTLDEETSRWLTKLSEETGTSKSTLCLQAVKRIREGDKAIRVDLPEEKKQKLQKVAEDNFRSPEDEARLAIFRHLDSIND
jgi:predicted transcriptional regulator